MCRTMPPPHKKPPWKKIYAALPFVCKYCRGLFPDFKFYRRHIRSHESRYKKFWCSSEWRAAKRRYSTSFLDEDIVDNIGNLRCSADAPRKVKESEKLAKLKRRHSYSYQPKCNPDVGATKPVVFSRGSRNGYTPRGITQEQAAMIAHYQRLQLSKHKAPERYDYDSDEDITDIPANGYHNIAVQDINLLIGQQIEQCKCNDCFARIERQKSIEEQERQSWVSTQQAANNLTPKQTVSNGASQTRHPINPSMLTPLSVPPMLPCPHCPVSFDRPDRLALHIKNHYANMKSQSPRGGIPAADIRASHASGGDTSRLVSHMPVSPRGDKRQYISSMLQAQGGDQQYITNKPQSLPQSDGTMIHQQRAADRGQMATDRGQRATDRGQRVTDRGQRAADRGQSATNRLQVSPNIILPINKQVRSVTVAVQQQQNSLVQSDIKSTHGNTSKSYNSIGNASINYNVNANVSNNNNAHFKAAVDNSATRGNQSQNVLNNNNNADRNFNVIQKAASQGGMKCAECGKMFTSEADLQDHQKYHMHKTATGKDHRMKKHALELAEDDSPTQKPYSCSYCPRTFTYWSSLKTHEFGHTGDPPFACTSCDEKFTQCSDLKLHERTHFGANSFKCGKCGRLFKHRPSLTAHENSHHGEDGKNICPVCLKTFSVGSNLRDHLRIHTGERPYQCANCGRGFIQKSHLRKHVMIHTGERPFKCQYCSKGFTQRGDVRRHEKIHRKVK